MMQLSTFFRFYLENEVSKVFTLVCLKTVWKPRICDTGFEHFKSMYPSGNFFTKAGTIIFVWMIRSVMNDKFKANEVVPQKH